MPCNCCTSKVGLVHSSSFCKQLQRTPVKRRAALCIIITHHVPHALLFLRPAQGGRLALNDSARVLETAPLRMQSPGDFDAAYAAKAPLPAGGTVNGAPPQGAAAASSYAGAVAPLQEPAPVERDPFGRALVPPPLGEPPHPYPVGLTPRDSARVIEASRFAFIYRLIKVTGSS